MDAIEFLIHDHKSLEELFEKASFQNFVDLRTSLIRHVNLEEYVFYPGLLKSQKVEGTVLEAWEDHNICMQLLQELDDTEDEKIWTAKFNTLKKLVLDHFLEEERDLFPVVSKNFDAAWLMDTGQVMSLYRPEIEPDKVLYPEEPGSHRPWKL